MLGHKLSGKCHPEEEEEEEEVEVEALVDARLRLSALGVIITSSGNLVPRVRKT